MVVQGRVSFLFLLKRVLRRASGHVDHFRGGAEAMPSTGSESLPDTTDVSPLPCSRCLPTTRDLQLDQTNVDS